MKSDAKESLNRKNNKRTILEEELNVKIKELGFNFNSRLLKSYLSNYKYLIRLLGSKKFSYKKGTFRVQLAIEDILIYNLSKPNIDNVLIKKPRTAKFCFLIMEILYPNPMKEEDLINSFLYLDEENYPLFLDIQSLGYISPKDVQENIEILIKKGLIRRNNDASIELTYN